MPRRILISLTLFALLGASARATDPAAEMADAATAWLQSLDVTQRAQASFPLASAERENWYYVPIERKGLPLRDMTPAQRNLARRLINTALSQRAQLQTEAIIALENVLHAMEGTARRNPELYYFTVFGAPAPLGHWGWRAEGHHLSLNFTLADGRVAVTPLFLGANPAEVRIDHPQKRRRALAPEEDAGRHLVKLFRADQLQVVLIAAKSPADVITGNDRQVQPTTPAGLAYAAMTTEQQNQLRAILEVYTSRLRPELAAIETAKIVRQGWDQIHFAWAGGLDPGQGHYYRIQGPGFVIEYDNTQDQANHIHTTWRSFTGDFGRDLLREHYEQDHPAAK